MKVNGKVRYRVCDAAQYFNKVASVGELEAQRTLQCAFGLGARLIARTILQGEI